MKSLRFRLALGVLAAVALMALFLRGVDTATLGATLARAQVLPLLGVVLLTILAYAVRAVRWGRLLEPIGKVPRRDLFSATMVGFAASLLIPRSGELLRPWLVARRHAMPSTAAFATIVIERLVDLISVLVVLALYLLVEHFTPGNRVAGEWLQWLNVGGVVAGGVALALLLLLMALHHNAERTAAVIERLFSIGPRWLASRVAGVLRGFSGGLAVLRAPARLWAVVAAESALLWLLTAFGYHLVHIAFGIELPFHVTFLLIAFLVVGESIPTPGLIGGFHAFYLITLAEICGVERSTAAAAGITAHALTNLPVLLIGAALLGREGGGLRRITEAARGQATG